MNKREGLEESNTNTQAPMVLVVPFGVLPAAIFDSGSVVASPSPTIPPATQRRIDNLIASITKDINQLQNTLTK